MPLLCTPTPLHPLPRLSSDLAVDLWIKRDDLTGFAGGGNKGRKLEYLLAAALESGADTVVTCGSAQSNFIRQLAAGCSMLGLRCCAVVMDLPCDASQGPAQGPRLESTGGNLLLDGMLGAEIEVLPDGDWDTLFQAQEQMVLRESGCGRRVYSIPVGGSSSVGAYGFVSAGEELLAQSATPFDSVVVPTSSGSTHTGLAYALKGTGTRVVGIACDPEPNLVNEEMLAMAEGLDAITGLGKNLRAEEMEYRLDWVGAGYGILSEQGRRATLVMARREGIFLDPVYSAKAFAGLMELVARRELSGRVLFWHTGGFPTVFATPTDAYSDLSLG